MVATKKIQKIVLTGGPGVGKTAILIALERLGEYVIKEAATDYIMYKQAMNISRPWEEEDFQLGILKLQQMREQRIPAGINRIFLDRSCCDGLAYQNPTTDIYQTLLKASHADRYDIVFLIEPLDFCKTTQVRREDTQEALTLSKKIENVYRDAGFDTIIIQKGPLLQRVQQILDELLTLEKTKNKTQIKTVDSAHLS